MRKCLYDYFVIQNNIEYLIKRLIYIICGISFCYIDQIVGSATGYIQNGYRNYVAVLLLLIILTAYRFKDFIKVRYLLYIIISFLSALFINKILINQVENKISLNAHIFLLSTIGLIVIRKFEYYFIEKNKLYINRSSLALFILMTIMMIIIRNDYVWTITLLVVNVLLYFTEFTTKDINNLIMGMLDGIIIGFIFIQSRAIMFRPYDILRYYGMYSHPNMNALFYLCVLCAILSKGFYFKTNKKKTILQVLSLIISGFLISFMLYTGSRTAFITFIILFVVFLMFQLIAIKKWKILRVIINSFVVIGSIAMWILPVYWLIRYVPVYFNEPIYFEADFEKIERKIQKNEDINSEKYISLNRAVDEMFSRYLWFLDDETAEYIEGFIRDFPESLNISLKADAATLDNITEYYVEPGSDKEHPLVLSGEKGEGAYDVRLDIYKYFWNKLELVGNKNNPIGVWTSNKNFAGHTHNLFLQIAYDFGIIVGVIFILLIVMIYVRIIMSLVKDRSPDNLFRMFVATMYVTLFVVFGMLEIDWRYGQLSFTMFFVVQYVIHHKMPEPEAVVEAAPVATGQYIVPGKGGFKELVIMDLDAEDPDQESDS